MTGAAVGCKGLAHTVSLDSASQPLLEPWAIVVAGGPRCYGRQENCERPQYASPMLSPIHVSAGSPEVLLLATGARAAPEMTLASQTVLTPRLRGVERTSPQQQNPRNGCRRGRRFLSTSHTGTFATQFKLSLGALHRSPQVITGSALLLLLASSLELFAVARTRASVTALQCRLR